MQIRYTKQRLSDICQQALFNLDIANQNKY